MELNYLAIIVAAAAHLVIGMAWYHPFVLGKTWMKHVGLSQKDLGKKHPIGSRFIACAGAVLMAIVMSFVATVFVRNVWGGFVTGFLTWAGFVATTTINPVLWERRDPHLFFVNNAYYLLSMIIMGIIISVWI